MAQDNMVNNSSMDSDNENDVEVIQHTLDLVTYSFVYKKRSHANNLHLKE